MLFYCKFRRNFEGTKVMSCGILVADAVTSLLITERLDTGCDEVHPLRYLMYNRSLHLKARKIERKYFPYFACLKEFI